jgi:hypothetical protein
MNKEDPRSLEIFLYKCVLQKIKAYRERYIEQKSLKVPTGKTGDDDEDWVTVIDDIIFTLRWHLDTDILEDTPEHIVFFKDYYGVNIDTKDGRDKRMELYNDSVRRAIKGFELFDRFFVRKTDMPDYDLISLDVSIAKCVLPKIKAYREMFIKGNKNLEGFNNGPYASLQEYIGDKEKERMAADVDTDWNEMSDGYKVAMMADEDKLWLIIIDETIYAMRWVLEVDMLNETHEKKAFFEEFYGWYVSQEDDKDKYIEQYDDSLYRAKRGFMSFGRFLSKCSYKMTMKESGIDNSDFDVDLI